MRKTALILGGFGSVGYACAVALAKNDHDLVIVHRGRRAKMDENRIKMHDLERIGANVIEIKGNASQQDCMKNVCDKLDAIKIHCLVHAIADGNVGNIFSGEKILSDDSFVHTFNSMCLSFASWVRVLMERKILAEGSYIFGFTSEGTYNIFPQYAANAVAKAGLETLCKYMAAELLPQKISVNVLRAGVMDTKAVRALGDYADLLSILKMEGCKVDTPDTVSENLISVMQNDRFISGQIIDV